MLARSWLIPLAFTGRHSVAERLHPEDHPMIPTPSSTSPIAVPCDNGALILIQPPEGWLMSPPQPPAKLALLDPNAPGPFFPNINVLDQDLGQMNVDEYLTLTRLQFKAMGDTVAILRDEALGKSAHWFEFISYATPLPIRCRQQVLFHSGRAYLVTAMAALHQYDAYRDRFEQCLGSVALRIAGDTTGPGGNGPVPGVIV